MSEELGKQLSSYKAQLQQVEVALSTDQDNEDLLKLQKDLQVRVCCFCRHCIGFGNTMQVKYFFLMHPILMIASPPNVFICLPQEVIDLTQDLLNSQPESTSTTNGSDTVPVKQGWKIGDRCMAVWSQDSQWVSLCHMLSVILIIILYCIVCVILLSF